MESEIEKLESEIKKPDGDGSIVRGRDIKMVLRMVLELHKRIEVLEKGQPCQECGGSGYINGTGFFCQFCNYSGTGKPATKEQLASLRMQHK